MAIVNLYHAEHKNNSSRLALEQNTRDLSICNPVTDDLEYIKTMRQTKAAFWFVSAAFVHGIYCLPRRYRCHQCFHTCRYICGLESIKITLIHYVPILLCMMSSKYLAATDYVYQDAAFRDPCFTPAYNAQVRQISFLSCYALQIMWYLIFTFGYWACLSG